MKQRTIQEAVSLSGVGLHTGKVASITIQPAEENHGIRFKRIDLEKMPTVNADVGKVSSTNRSTSLKSGEAEVMTVEHLLSALSGLGITNVLVELDAAELPILDGSAKLFVEALQKAGIEEQEASCECFVVTEPMQYQDETGAEYIALPHDSLELTTIVDFNSAVLGEQCASLKADTNYASEIAACRTFVFLKDIETLANQGLVKGGDLSNAIVIADELMPQAKLDALAAKLGKESFRISEEGIVNTSKLQFKNEIARHKLLDLLGDLTLLGRPIKAKIIATKPGHTSNVGFVKLLKAAYLKQRKLKGKPTYNPNKEPVYNTVQVMELLPHRYPFLLVDKVIELTDTQVVGIKNVTFNEQLFQGHFPNNPVFPGVLQVEAMAQTGGILALSLQEDPMGWDTYFLKVDETKFKAMVLPGDTLIIKMELLEPIRRGIVKMRGTTYVGDKIASEGIFAAQIVKRK